jgi:hypothetical protein
MDVDILKSISPIVPPVVNQVMGIIQVLVLGQYGALLRGLAEIPSYPEQLV